MLVRPVVKVPRWCPLKSSYFTSRELHVELSGVMLMYAVTYIYIFTSSLSALYFS